MRSPATSVMFARAASTSARTPGLPPVIPAPVFTAAAPPSGQVGVPYSYQFVASNASSYAVASGTLPSGLGLNSSTGVISGTPTTNTTYVFTISATGSGGTTNTSSKSVDIAASSGVGMSSLPYPVPTTVVPNSSPSFAASGQTVSGTISPTVRLTSLADPKGSGTTVYTHRVVKGEWVAGSTTARSEKLWIDFGSPIDVFSGEDHWYAFAFMPKSGEGRWTSPTGNSDDEFLIFQTHTESTGDTQPPIGLFFGQGGGTCYVQSSYDGRTQAVSYQGTTKFNLSQPLVDKWNKVIIHHKVGYNSSFSPRLEIWMDYGTGTMTKVVDNTNPNDYNWDTGSYPRIGIYKWSGTNWVDGSTGTSIALNMSTLYQERAVGGADLYTKALNSLSWVISG